jgi:asparagine synthase (glutamine-hydrolysing)
LNSFLILGYPLENRTWFKSVSLLPTGSVLTWNLKECRGKCNRYWWWSDIEQNKLSLNEDEIIDGLGYLFKKAVNKRSKGNIGITLSGGLDSRAILAAIKDPPNDFNAVTFGLRNCEDIRLARHAAKIKGVNHQVFELSESNWLINKFKSVWIVDGHLDISHMHATSNLSEYRGIMEYNLNGYAGDLILGGSFLNEKLLNSNGIDLALLNNNLGHKANSSFDISMYVNTQDYASLNKYDYFYLQNRVRRFTYSGSKILQSAIDNRKPFYDNQLIVYIFYTR